MERFTDYEIVLFMRKKILYSYCTCSLSDYVQPYEFAPLSVILYSHAYSLGELCLPLNFQCYGIHTLRMWQKYNNSILGANNGYYVGKVHKLLLFWWRKKALLCCQSLLVGKGVAVVARSPYSAFSRDQLAGYCCGVLQCSWPTDCSTVWRYLGKLVLLPLYRLWFVLAS